MPGNFKHVALLHEAGKPIPTRDESILEKKLGEGEFDEVCQPAAGDFGEAPDRNRQKLISDPTLGETIEVVTADAPDRLAKASEPASPAANRDRRNRELRCAGRISRAGVAALWLLAIGAAAGYGMWRAVQAERRMEAEKDAAEAAERKALRLADAGGKFINRSLTGLLDALDDAPGSASRRQALIGAAEEYVTGLWLEAADDDFTLRFSVSDAYRKLGNAHKAMGRGEAALRCYLNAVTIDSGMQRKALDFLNAHSENIAGDLENSLSLSSGYYQLGKFAEWGAGEEKRRTVETCYANVLKINKTLIGKIEERLRRSNGAAEAAAFIQLEHIYSQLGYISEYSFSPWGRNIGTGDSGEVATRRFVSESRFLQGEAERVFKDAKELGRFKELSGESGRYADIKNGNRDYIPVFSDVDGTIAQIVVNLAHNALCVLAVEDALGVGRGNCDGAITNIFAGNATELLSQVAAMRRADVRYPIPCDLFLPVFFRDPAQALTTALDEALLAVRKNHPEISADAEPNLRDFGDAFSRVPGLSVKPDMTVEEMRAVLAGICDNLAAAAAFEGTLDSSSGCFENFEIYDAIVNLHSVLRIISPAEADGAPDDFGIFEEGLKDLARDILNVVKMNAFKKDAPIPSHKLRKREIERNVDDTLADIEHFLCLRLERMTPDTLPAFSASPEAEDWKRSMENAVSDARALWNWDRERLEHGLLYSETLLLNALLRNMASEEDSAAKRNRLAECITELETLDREMNGVVERMKILLLFAHGMLGKNFLESNLVDEAETHFAREDGYIDALTGETVSFELWSYRIASLGNQVSLQVAKGRFEKIAAIYSDLVYFMESPLREFGRSIFLMREAERISGGAFEFLKVMLDICGIYYRDDKGEAHYSEVTGLDSAEAKAGLSMIFNANAVYRNRWKLTEKIDGDPRIGFSRRKLTEVSREFMERDTKIPPDGMLDIICKALVRGREYVGWCAFWH